MYDVVDRLSLDRLFVSVLDTGTFAAAAARMGISSGQASKMVSRLEADLGVQLIKRTTRALSPTEVGQAYYERIRAILDERDELDASIRNIAGAPSGRLRITAPTSFGPTQLMPALLDFAEQYDAIQIDVSFTDRMVDLVEDGFDLAVRVGQLADSTLVARKLCDARLVTVAAPAYIEQYGAPRRPEELIHHTCIIDTNLRTPRSWPFSDPVSGQPMTVPVSGRLSLSNGEACMTAAQRGLGIACVPSFIAGPCIRDGKLVAILRDAEPRSLGVYVVYPPARHLALKTRAASDFLARHFKGKPDWDKGW